LNLLAAGTQSAGGGEGRRWWRVEEGWMRDDGGEALAELLASAKGGI
jgi:hypothetical protein